MVVEPLASSSGREIFTAAIFEVATHSQISPGLQFRRDEVGRTFRLKSQRIANKVQIGLIVANWNKKLVSETCQRIGLIKLSSVLERDRFGCHLRRTERYW